LLISGQGAIVQHSIKEAQGQEQPEGIIQVVGIQKTSEKAAPAREKRQKVNAGGSRKRMIH